MMRDTWPVRLGIIADIHGNDVALRAVLNDAEHLGVDRWWALGDLVLFCPRPAEVLELLLALPAIGMLRGNTDRYVLTGEQPAPHVTAADAAAMVYPRVTAADPPNNRAARPGLPSTSRSPWAPRRTSAAQRRRSPSHHVRPMASSTTPRTASTPPAVSKAPRPECGSMMTPMATSTKTITCTTAPAADPVATASSASSAPSPASWR